MVVFVVVVCCCTLVNNLLCLLFLYVAFFCFFFFILSPFVLLPPTQIDTCTSPPPSLSFVLSFTSSSLFFVLFLFFFAAFHFFFFFGGGEGKASSKGDGVDGVVVVSGGLGAGVCATCEIGHSSNHSPLSHPPSSHHSSFSVCPPPSLLARFPTQGAHPTLFFAHNAHRHILDTHTHCSGTGRHVRECGYYNRGWPIWCTRRPSWGGVCGCVCACCVCIVRCDP